MREAVDSSEPSMRVCQTTRNHISQDRNVRSYLRENFEFHVVLTLFTTVPMDLREDKCTNSTVAGRCTATGLACT
jgi:hypothetical protein